MLSISIKSLTLLLKTAAVVGVPPTAYAKHFYKVFDRVTENPAVVGVPPTAHAKRFYKVFDAVTENHKAFVSDPLLLLASRQQPMLGISIKSLTLLLKT